jgi:hypothetical protein
MRTIGHAVKADMLKTTYEVNRKRVEAFAAKRDEQLKKRNPLFFQGYMENSLRVARLNYLFDGPLRDSIAALRAALPELPRVFELGGMFHPRLMQEFLGAALLAREPKMTSWLADLPPQAYRHPGMQTSEVHYLIVEAEQAGARGDKAAFAATVAKLRPELEPRKLIVEPKGELAIFGPVVTLLEAVAAGNAAALDQAWKAEGDAWKARYSGAAEVANADGVLDVEALGIARIAQNFGLKIPSSNPYAPAELLAEAEKMK